MTLIELDRPRKFCLTINAVADAEALVGKNMEELLKEGGIRATRAFLWAGLKWDDRSLTPEVVGNLMEKWMETKTFQDIWMKIRDALNEQRWYQVMREESQRGESKGGSPPDT